MTRGWVALMVVGVLLTAAGPAHAGTVTIDASTQTLTYRGDAGANRVDVFQFQQTDGIYETEIRDFNFDTTSTDPACSTDSVGNLYCYTAAPLRQELYLGDGDDNGQPESRYVPTGNLVDGENGNDSVEGSSGAETLRGGPGNDSLSSDGGPSGGVPLPTGAHDVLSGGDGTDTADYFGEGGSESTLSISLDGVANDGVPGEDDNVGTDVEDIKASSYAPTKMVGSDAPNVLQGYSSADTLQGLGGDDQLFGAGGDDALDGGAGNDKLEGGSDDDALVGGPGTDSFAGDFSGGYDQVVQGNDTILSADGVPSEPVSCGPGADTATVDPGDTLATDPQNACETVRKVAVAAKVDIASSRLRLSRGRVAVALRCAAGTDCAGRLQVRTTKKVRVGQGRARVTLASGAFTVPAGTKKTVSVKASALGRSVVPRRGGLGTTVTATLAGSKRAAATRKLTVRRP